MNNELFKRIVSWDNILDAYKKTQKGKSKYKYDAMKFKEDEISNLLNLKYSLIYGTYTHSGYTKFAVYEPKLRMIYAPKYIDKIVQHMINNVLRDIYEPTFIYDSYACIRGKGNQAAVKRIQQYQRMAYRIYDNPYLLKIDISKFFYTIDRGILKNILIRKIKDKHILSLLYSIIDSFTEPLGLPLGNLTSQLFANIYLNEIDQRIKHFYRVKFYVRYADDMFLILEDKDIANRLKLSIATDITSILHLLVNPKKVYIKPSNIIDGLGFKIGKDNIRLLNKNKISLRKLIKYENPNRLNSWYGYAHISSCYGLIRYNLLSSNSIDFNNNKFNKKTS